MNTPDPMPSQPATLREGIAAEIGWLHNQGRQGFALPHELADRLSALLEVGEEGRGERITVYRGLYNGEPVTAWLATDEAHAQKLLEGQDPAIPGREYEVREALLLPTETRAEEGRAK